MTSRIFVYVVHKGGVPADSTVELLGAAQKIDSGQKATAVVTGSGPELERVCESLRTSFAEVWKISHPALVYPNAELVRQALASVLPHGCLLLAAHDYFGVDLSPGLSIKLDAAYVPDVVGINGAGSAFLELIRQEFGGQLSTHVRCDVSSGAVLNVRPGAFQAAERNGATGVVIDKSSGIGTLAVRRRYLKTVTAEKGDVDITKHQILVSIGRGIQDPENVDIAEKLAEALGGAVSCSRPVADAKWMDKSRQVGTSGQTVKPKVYLACGISGSFQHMAGVQGNALIIAINKNASAPIFRVAEVGIVDDILEFLPVLTERVREQTALAAPARSAP